LARLDIALFVGWLAHHAKYNWMRLTCFGYIRGGSVDFEFGNWLPKFKTTNIISSIR
jgi:hypothetical protein